MLRLAAFGGLALLGPDGPLAGSAARGRNLALLALLVRAGNAGLTRDKLAAYLWPEADAERSRHSLDQALYTLRRTLGADAIVSGATTIALDDRIVPSDVVEFTRAFDAGAMRAAVDLYRGPFLDGFHLSGSPAFERWVDGERAALHGQFAAALEALAREAAQAGDYAAAIASWRRLAAAEPFNSRVALGLMRELATAGDRAAAMQVARVHATLVREELDAPPDPAIVAFVEELRRLTEASSAPVTDPGVTAHSGAPPIEPLYDTTTTHARDATLVTSPAVAAVRRAPVARRVAAIAAIAAIVAAGGWTVLATRGATGAERLPRVAVMPFDNGSGEVALEPLGQMAADWITEGLVRTGLVRVIEPSAVKRGAESVVSGRIHVQGDTVWLQARITQPHDGVVLRALDAVGAPTATPAATLEPLRQQVLGALGTLFDPRLSAWAETALRPPMYAAYREFAAGVELHAVPRDLAGATAHFRRAVALDPDYVLPQLWLAWASIIAGAFARADSVVAALGAQRETMSPLERAWHDRIGAVLAGDNEASYRAARRMVEIAPRSGWAIALANSALDTNRPRIAAAVLEEAGIDRLGLEREHGWFLLTAAYHALGDYHRELETAERAIRSDGLGWGFTGPGVTALAALGRIDALEQRLHALRDLPPLEDGVPRGTAALLAAVAELRAHGFAAEAAPLADRLLARAVAPEQGGGADGRGRWARAQLLYELGRWDDAARTLGAPDDDGDAWRHHAMAALLAARRGDTATARRVAADLSAIEAPYLFGEPTFWRARIAAVLHEAEHAVALLRQAFAEGQYSYAWHLVHASRDFETLRSSRAFQELVRPKE